MDYLANVLEQPAVLQSVAIAHKEAPEWSELQRLWSKRRELPLICTGLGASFNASYPTCYTLLQQGIPVLHLDTGELLHHMSELLASPLILVVVSQSGESIEIRKLLEQLQSVKAPQTVIISITNQPDNTLARQSDLAFYTRAGAEVGVATKTYTSTLAILHWLVRSLVGDLNPDHFIQVLSLAESLQQWLKNWEGQVQAAVYELSDLQQFALVGRGPAIASAYNGALVIQESLRLLAAGYPGAQFRHGPMEMISPELGTILWNTSRQTLDISSRMAQDIRDRGGRLVTIGAESPGLGKPHISLPDCAEALYPILEIVPIQLIVAKLASAMGLTPGQFRWSGKVIEAE